MLRNLIKIDTECLPMWNSSNRKCLRCKSMDPVSSAIASHASQETLIFSAEDIGTDPPVTYVNAATVADPGYPYQYTTSVNIRRDDIILSVSPPPTGDLKLRYFQYDLGEACLNIASGGVSDCMKESMSALRVYNRLCRPNGSMFLTTRKSVGLLSIIASQVVIVGLPGMTYVRPLGHFHRSVPAEKLSPRKRSDSRRMSAGHLRDFSHHLLTLCSVREKELLVEPDKTYFEHDLSSTLKAE